MVPKVLDSSVENYRYIIFLMLHIEKLIKHCLNVILCLILTQQHILSEKRVLPSLVLGSFIVYFIVAIVLYYNY